MKPIGYVVKELTTDLYLAGTKSVCKLTETPKLFSSVGSAKASITQFAKRDIVLIGSGYQTMKTDMATFVIQEVGFTVLNSSTFPEVKS